MICGFVTLFFMWIDCWQKKKMIYLHKEEKPKTIADEKNAIISVIVPFHNDDERASGGSIA